ncbi:catalase [Psychromonas sp. 14N.309.X.WAT.B.A12]|uniref:catalase n=1 Tax=Psychromonas sp. 14N.309.X.WAT.B.A12 TaxID=2998322 RepID=UPI0025AF0DDE|nr:catalase [Psychromonas sp. 14N.309.X.WAT.B.A12]MDN2662693.1 catalase [Psychromonas sp. 14N.309.X.WAT.B.A12]
MTESFKYSGGKGKGGELHQSNADAYPTMTTSQGCPISDDQNSLKAGANGPTLMEDHILREKLFHFDHERIPERVVHARGYGAHGYFENYESLSDITCADIFQRAGEKTPLFTRISTVAGNKGSGDLARDVRGFAVKFYTKKGNWDLVGNNIPVFFIQDAMKFPDLIHSAKAEPDRGFPQAQTAHDNFWDFVSLTPEAMNMVMWTMSDRAIPRSLRFMEGFGVHTFKMINAKGEEKFVKFHWKPKLGMQSVVWNEALKINGADPDFHRRDIWESILANDYPEWELGLQVFDQQFADDFEFDIFDPTKLIPEEQVPIKIVGRMVLDRVVDNFFAETEQVAFCTQNIVPGIDFTPDPLLQGRNFSYLDTQTKRLGGPNFTDIPINAPKCPMHHFQQDGHMAMNNPKGRVNYEPNSWDADENNPRACPEQGFKSSSEQMTGDKTRYRSDTFSDHYSQARQFYLSQTDVEQQHIQSALVFELSKVEKLAIRERLVSHLINIDKKLAEEVATGLGFETMPAAAEAAKATRTDLPVSDALSILKNSINTFKGRKLGILISEGFDGALFKSVTDALADEGARYEVIAADIGGAVCSKGNHVKAQQAIAGGPSVLYDAVLVLVSNEGADYFATVPEAKDFISDAYSHKKFIGYTPQAQSLLKAVGLDQVKDNGMINLDDKEADSFIKTLRALRFWER